MGGVGWGMLRSCSWYVDRWGGVGHVNVMFMVRGNFEKEHVAACCSRVLTLKQQREKKCDYQYVPFHANIKSKQPFILHHERQSKQYFSAYKKQRLS